MDGEVIPGVVGFGPGEEEPIAPIRKRKRKQVLVGEGDVLPFVQEMQSKMPAVAKRIDRRNSELAKVQPKKPIQYVSAYDVKIPPGQDEFRWLREQGLAIVKRFQVEMVSHPELQPLEIWASDEGEAIFVFHSHYKIQRPEGFKYHVVECPPKKDSSGNPSAQSPQQKKPNG